MNLQKTITPIDNSIYLERELASDSKINSVIDKASTSFEIWKITSALSSAAISAYAFSRVAGSALSSDTIKLSAKQVNALPLPAISDYWEQASEYAEEAFSSKLKDAKTNKMKEMSHKISLAYGYDDDLLEEWWIKRLPKWR